MEYIRVFFFFFQAEDGIRDADVTGVQTCALPISELVLQALDLGNVARERLLRADRDGLGGEIERPRIDPASAVAEQRPELARQQPAEGLVRKRGEVADRLDPGST